MDKGKERITIGVLVGGIMDYFTIGICRGVAQMARTFDVDVVVLPGKYVNRKYHVPVRDLFVSFLHIILMRYRH